MTRLAKTRKIVFWAIVNVALLVLILALVEGLSSLALFVQRVARTPVMAERRHTQYDPLLGWVNLPNVDIKNMYGRGIYLRTNSQAFRNNADFSVAVPANKVRIICSGDSFTFGYGVDNDHTWCQLLAAKDSRLEAVNMGQGGYGVDQAYLWYKRDGVRLAHDIHLFAFISADFRRAAGRSFFGYGKPLLKLENDQLVVTNVPVPKRAFVVPWLTQNRAAINSLKTSELLRLLATGGERITSPPADGPAGGEPAGAESTGGRTLQEPVAGKILAELAQLNRANNSVLVLVYLPVHNPGPEAPKWREYVHRAAEQLGLLLVDLTDAFNGLSSEEVTSLFIQEGQLDYTNAGGHYTVSGNQRLADILHEKLLSFPEVRKKLAGGHQ